MTEVEEKQTENRQHKQPLLSVTDSIPDRLLGFLAGRVARETNVGGREGADTRGGRGIANALANVCTSSSPHPTERQLAEITPFCGNFVGIT